MSSTFRNRLLESKVFSIQHINCKNGLGFSQGGKNLTVVELGFSPLLKIAETDDISYSERKSSYFSCLESTSIKESPVRIKNLCAFGDIPQQDEKRSCQTDVNRFQKITGLKRFSKVNTVKNPMNNQDYRVG